MISHITNPNPITNTITNPITNNITNNSYTTNVVNVLRSYFYPTCGHRCRLRSVFFNGYIHIAPVLIRQSNKICEVCGIDNTSYSHFKACIKCATETEFPIEFNYYHSNCRVREVTYDEQRNINRSGFDESDIYMN
jgi:hypothetical protein